MANPRGIWINEKNILAVSVYFTIRHCIEHTWINHNDQFLHPNENYKNDIGFRNDCLIYTLFHVKNAIQSHFGINHWIPFTEQEIDAKKNLNQTL
jgi:patatin-like phospholipase/acyl hydrolase